MGDHQKPVRKNRREILKATEALLADIATCLDTKEGKVAADGEHTDIRPVEGEQRGAGECH